MRFTLRLGLILFSIAAVVGVSHAYAAILVQQAQNSGAGVVATSTSLTFPSDITGGDTIIAVTAIEFDSSGPTDAVVTDSLGQTWHLAGTVKSGTYSGAYGYAVYYLEDSVGGADTISLTSSSTAPSVDMGIFEYSGIATPSALDVATSSIINISGGTPYLLPSVSTTNSDDLVLGIVSTGVAGTVTTTLPYVLHTPTAAPVQLVDQSVSSAGTINGAQITQQYGGPDSGAFTIAFKAQPSPILSVATSSSLSYSASDNGASSTQDIVVSNTGATSTSFYWTATSTASWLSFSTSSGTLAGATSSSIGLIADPTGLSSGTYNATATITAAGAEKSPISLPVSLTVTANPNLTSCGVLNAASTTYVLQNDVEASGTCFSVQADDITLNLNGHTVTYGDGPLLSVANGGFESGSGTSTPDWDLSQASDAQIIQGSFTNPVEVLSGSSSLAFTVPLTSTTTETAVNTQAITMPANRTYLAEAWFFESPSLENATGIINQTIFLEDASSGAILASSTAAGYSYRGFAAVGIPYTPTSTRNVKIGVQVSGSPGGNATGTLYFDDISFWQGPSHGVMAASSYAPVGYGITLASDTDLMYGGSANSLTVENGTFVQGAGDGVDSGAIEFYQGAGNGLTVTNVTSTMYGVDPINIELQYSNSDTITANHLYSSSTLVTFRDEQLGDGIKINPTYGDVIENNIITGGPQIGIDVSEQGASATTTSIVEGNTISQDARYSNDFSIDTVGNVEVYDNTVNPTSGRGVISDGGSGGNSGTSLHNNTITVTELPLNQEYDGCESGGAYGIQFDNNPVSTTAYDNTVTAIAGACWGIGLRVTDSETLTNVSHDNNYTAEVTPTSTSMVADAFYGDGPTGFTSRNDTFAGDSADIVFGYPSSTNVMFYSPTVDKGPNASAGWTLVNFSDLSPNDMTDIHLVDPVFGPGVSATSTDMESMSVSGGGYEEYFIDYTNTLTVQDASSSPLSGVDVSIANASGTVVATGTTASNGTLASVLNDLHVYNTSSSVVFADANPYTMTLSRSGCTDATSSLTMATTTSETLTFCGSGAATTSTAPQSLAATAGDSQVSLSWAAPSSNGGSTITQYDVDYKLDASSTYTQFATTTVSMTTSTVTGLTNGSLYDFEILAENGIGTSSPSNVVTATPTAATTTTYYVSYAGSDTNNGTSTGASLLTLGKLMTTSAVSLPASSTATSTASLTFTDATEITPAANVTITIPASTTLTSATTTDFTAFVATTTVDTSGLPSGYTSVGAVAFGLPSSTVTLDQAITISIPVTASLDGETLTVYRQEPGSSTWTDITTCTVSSSLCSFTTSNLSSFVVASNASASSSGITIIVAAGGGGPLPFATSTSSTTTTTSTSSSTTLTALANTLHALEAQLLVLIAQAQQQGIAVPAIPASIGGTAPTTSYVFTRDLQLHDQGADVKALQQFLINAASGPEATALGKVGVTGYFGPLTFRALQKYQASNGIPSTGYFGPITRGKVGTDR